MRNLLVLLACLTTPSIGQETVSFRKIVGTSWAEWSEKDAMTDKTNASARLWSIDGRYQLDFSCSNSLAKPVLSASIYLPFYAGGTFSTVVLRFDEGKPDSSLWDAKDEMVVGFDARGLAKRVRSAKVLAVRIADNKFQGHDASFKTEGGAAAVDKIFEACGKKPPV